MTGVITFTHQQDALYYFVEAAHSGQKRKYTGEEYLHHLLNVTLLVQQALPPTRNDFEIAISHDLLEDTAVTREELAAFLIEHDYSGDDTAHITGCVQDLTSQFTRKAYPTWDRLRRKRYEALRLVGIHPDAQTIKYADIIDNLSTIAHRDPDFAIPYIAEKDLYIHEMNKGNPRLYMKALKVIQKAKEKVGMAQ